MNINNPFVIDARIKEKYSVEYKNARFPPFIIFIFNPVKQALFSLYPCVFIVFTYCRLEQRILQLHTKKQPFFIYRVHRHFALKSNEVETNGSATILTINRRDSVSRASLHLESSLRDTRVADN